MKLLGKKATFIPHFAKDKTGKQFEEEAEVVTGTITYVNLWHRWFCVTFQSGNTIQRECFKFYDIGERVTVHGK